MKTKLAQRQFVCDHCGTRIDRDLNAALNLAALADQVLHGQLDRDVKLPAGNPGKTAIGGNVLVAAGLPEPVAALIADSDLAIARGEVYTDSGDLSKLIGRPTTTLAEALKVALRT